MRFRVLICTFLASLLTSAGSPGQEENPEQPLSFADAVERVAPSVVTILNLGKLPEKTVNELKQLPEAILERHKLSKEIVEFDGIFYGTVGHGSGAIIDRQGHILTNHHVVDRKWMDAASDWIGADTFAVSVGGSQVYLKADLVGSDAATDVAVLKLGRKNLPAAPIGDSGKLRVGDIILAIGTPRSLELNQTVTMGVVSALGRSENRSLLYEDFIQTDAAINPGNSGGPVINALGEIVGLSQSIRLSEVTGGGDSDTGQAMSDSNTGIGFAVPINLVMRVKDEIIENGSVSRGYLGVKMRTARSAPVTEFSSSFAGSSPQPSLSRGTGVLVEEVLEGGPAGQGGIKVDDHIINFAGESIDNASELRYLTALTRPGTEVEMQVVRGGAQVSVKVKIGSLKGTQYEAIGFEPGARKSRKSIPGIIVTEDTITLNRIEGKGFDERDVLLITDVRKDSEAWKSGLRTGQILIHVLGIPVSYTRDLDTLLQSHTGDALLIGVADRKSRQNITLKLK